MWKLDDASEEDLNYYVGDLMPLIKNRLEKLDTNDLPNTPARDIRSLLMPGVTDTQNEYILRHLLIDKPTDAKKLVDMLCKQLIPGYDEKELECLAKLWKNPKSTDSLVQKYELLKRLSKVFDYDELISKRQSLAYWITKTKNVNTCTYCNRQYVFTVEDTDGEKIARPELDHWFPKKLYPLLALNYYNLIPSCSICNSSIKGDTIFSLETHVHPHEYPYDNPRITFRANPMADGEWGVDIETTEAKEEKMIEDFALREIYGLHGPIEVKDLERFVRENNREYIDTLFLKVLDDFCGVYSQEEVYRMLFGTEPKPENFRNRPSSKLKYDLLKNLGVNF